MLITFVSFLLASNWKLDVIVYSPGRRDNELGVIYIAYSPASALWMPSPPPGKLPARRRTMQRRRVRTPREDEEKEESTILHSCVSGWIGSGVMLCMREERIKPCNVGGSVP